MNDAGLGLIVASLFMGACAGLGAIGGLPSQTRSATHMAYLEMTQNRRIPYYEREVTPGYGVKKGAIAGAGIGAGICALVLSAFAADEIKRRIKNQRF
jgi:hypothetical protein